MFVGCSEISMNVIVKDVQNIDIIRAFCLPDKKQNKQNKNRKIKNRNNKNNYIYITWDYAKTFPLVLSQPRLPITSKEYLKNNI